MKMLAIREKFKHMSDISGYDAIYCELDAYLTIDSIFGNFQQKFPKGIGRILSSLAKYNAHSEFYKANSLATEIKTILCSFTKNYEFIHYSYGETYWGIHSNFKRKIKTIVTNHQPVSWQIKNLNYIKSLNKASTVIALSHFDFEFLKTNKIYNSIYIPHGVNIQYFRPELTLEKNDKFKIVVSGRYLRDFETLEKVISLASEKYDDIVFQLILEDKSNYINSCLCKHINKSYIEWHTNISLSVLRNIYQKANCLLLTLLDSTANNALLESMACGLPIIVTNLPSVNSYINTDCGFLCNSIDEYLESIDVLYTDNAKAKNMSLNSRDAVVNNFSWEIISKKTFSHLLEL